VKPAQGSRHSGKRALVAGALLMAVATAIGALSAHRIKNVLPSDSYAVLQTAILYQFLNALGLLGVGLLLERRGARALALGADLLLAGVLLFSGSLYALLSGAPRAVGVLTPIGGMCLILGWCAVALALLRAPDQLPP
jgi:uncharacterized membrane protein YgdD (TMEM256/DUF423 family)